jgi:hypothetical protein
MAPLFKELLCLDTVCCVLKELAEEMQVVFPKKSKSYSTICSKEM